MWSDGTFAVPDGRGRRRHRTERLGQDDAAPGAARAAAADRGHASRCSATRPERGNRAHRLRAAELHRGASATRSAAATWSTLGLTGTRCGLRSADRRATAPRVDAALARVGATRLREPADVAAVRRPAAARRHRAGARRRPELLLLDEPLANLDLRNQHEIVDAARASCADERNVTVLVVAHDLNPLLSVLTGAVYLLDGHPHYDDDRRGRRRGPAHPPLRHRRSGSCAPPQGDLFTRNA